MKSQNPPNSDPSLSVFRRVRVRSEDSAFIYQILEASEGVCAYSTLPHVPGDRHRDLELIVPISLVPEMDRILADLHSQLAGEFYILPEPSSRDERSENDE